MKISKLLQLIFTFSFPLIILTGCVNQAPINPVSTVSANTIPSEYQPKTLVAQESMEVVLPSFQELYQLSDIVIVGKVKQKDKIFNSSRKPDNPSEEDPNSFSIAQVYIVEVDQYIKGDGPKKIYVSQGEGRIDKSEQTKIDQKELEKVISDNEGKTFIKLKEDGSYLMFLQVFTDNYGKEGYKHGTLFHEVGKPWRFAISDTNVVVFEDEIVDLANYFPPLPLKDVVVEMRKPRSTSTPESPYPAIQPSGITTESVDLKQSTYPSP